MMKSFLQLTAESLYDRFGDEVSNLTIVFPNYRARLFFSQHLINKTGKPIWSPSFTSIKDLYQEKSSLLIEENLRLICILYKHYKKHIEEKNELCEPFDNFYFWGEILLSDFDDVDKNLVDAKLLFNNMKDLAEMKNVSEYLTEEQSEVLRRFFASFSEEKQTKLREHFINVWDCLYGIYKDFKAELREKGIAYEGMVYRDVVENFENDSFPAEKYVFIGFNVLNKCETELFKKIYKCNKALFYWDYDTYYTQFKIHGDRSPHEYRHEAGTFINENLSHFPNELNPSLFNEFDNTPKEINIISASTENAQARYLYAKLSELAQDKDNKAADIAVVLCNEGLLLPVLHSIPKGIFKDEENGGEEENMNVTMGFPLSQTPIYSLVISLLEIQKTSSTKGFRFSAIIQLMANPYMKTLFCNNEKKSENLDQKIIDERVFFPTAEFLNEQTHSDLFRRIDDNDCKSLISWLLHFIEAMSLFHRNSDRLEQAFEEENKTTQKNPLYDDLYKEAVFRTYTVIKQIENTLTNNEIDINYTLIFKLLPRFLASVSIPFKGEPIKGMQVMGFLETRNLDFKNVILLSVNEGTIPSSGKDSSFIPHLIRKAYGMTTIEHKNSLYAYYFYRLLQRASNVTILYNSTADSKSRGEKSRFIWQLQGDTTKLQEEGKLKLNFFDIRSSIASEEKEEITIEKTDEMVDSLRERFRHNALSPSALNTYLDCKLKFYFTYVKQLKKNETIDDDVNVAQFGKIFHHAAQHIYSDLSKNNKLITKEMLEETRADKEKIKRYVDDAFRSEYFKLRSNDKQSIEYNGKQLIHRDVEVRFIENLLKKDIEEAPIEILGLEKKTSIQHDVEANGEKFQIELGGIIDRYDKRNGIVNVIDYKTGGMVYNAEIKIEELFTPKKKRDSKVLQTMLYSYILRKLGITDKITSRLFFVCKENIEPKSFYLQKDKELLVEDYYEDLGFFLEKTTNEIFDKKVSFTQADERLESCKYCDFIELCRR